LRIACSSRRENGHGITVSIFTNKTSPPLLF
jgi:hypothetical protein